MKKNTEKRTSGSRSFKRAAGRILTIAFALFLVAAGVSFFLHSQFVNSAPVIPDLAHIHPITRDGTVVYFTALQYALSTKFLGVIAVGGALIAGLLSQLVQPAQRTRRFAG